MQTVNAPADDGVIVAASLNRIILAVLALVSVLIAAYMSLYSIGVLTTPACGSGSCEAVQASPWSTFFGVPVPLIGVVGYALILGVAVAGVQPAFVDDRRVAAALISLSAVAFLFSMYLSGVEAFLIRAWCRWCIGSTVVSTLLFLMSLPELRKLRERWQIDDRYPQ